MRAWILMLMLAMAAGLSGQAAFAQEEDDDVGVAPAKVEKKVAPQAPATEPAPAATEVVEPSAPEAAAPVEASSAPLAPAEVAVTPEVPAVLEKPVYVNPPISAPLNFKSLRWNMGGRIRLVLAQGAETYEILLDNIDKNGAADITDEKTGIHVQLKAIADTHLIVAVNGPDEETAYGMLLERDPKHVEKASSKITYYYYEPMGGAVVPGQTSTIFEDLRTVLMRLEEKNFWRIEQTGRALASWLIEHPEGYLNEFMIEVENGHIRKVPDLNGQKASPKEVDQEPAVSSVITFPADTGDVEMAGNTTKKRRRVDVDEDEGDGLSSFIDVINGAPVKRSNKKLRGDFPPPPGKKKTVRSAPPPEKVRRPKAEVGGNRKRKTLFQDLFDGN